MSAIGSEQVAVIGSVEPDAMTAGIDVTGWIPAQNFHSFMAIIQAGTLGSSATFNAKIQQATDASATGAKDITGKAITELTEAGTDSNKQAVINLQAEELDVKNGFNHIQLSVTVAVATSDGSAVLLGLNPRHAPASDNDISTVGA